MELPRQVQQQTAELEELEKQLFTLDDTDDNEALEATVEDTEVGETKTDTKEVAEDPGEVEPTGKANEENPPNEFEQKYNSLRGKYDTEVPRLRKQVDDLTAHVTQLAALQEKAQKEPVKEPKKPTQLVTDADRKTYGEDLLDVQRRVAQEVTQEYEARFEQQNKVIADLQTALGQTGEQIGQVNFEQKLVQLVPDFTQVDTDERWAAWLDEIDPMTNSPRREIATNAFTQGNAEAVAHYVGLFKQSVADVVPVKESRQAELEKQVSPTRSVSSKQTSSTSKTYSEADADKVWKKIETLNKSGNYDAASKLEADLTIAYQEGRVQSG